MPTLGIDQSAEPGQCGSCQHFRHRQDTYDTMGPCSLKLPPWVEKKYGDPTKEWEVDPRTVRDTDTCSFYEARNLAGDPVEFIQQRIWRAGNPSK